MSKIKLLLFELIICINLITPPVIQAKSLAFFSPDDKPRSKLINLINQTKYKIQAAVYVLTDKLVAESLIQAKKRGVKVEIVTDRNCVTMPFGKISMLKNNDIEVFVFSLNPTKRIQPLMHNKFAIFEINNSEKNKKVNQWVWTGSFNWTVSANKSNQENVILTNSRGVVAKYKKQFEILKRRCVLKHLNIKHKTNKVAQNKKEDDSLVYKIKNLLRFIREQYQG